MPNNIALMILLKYVYNMRIYSVERTRGRCEDNHIYSVATCCIFVICIT